MNGAWCALAWLPALGVAATAADRVVILEERSSVAPSTTDFTFTCPPFSVEHQVRLSLEARIEHPALAGSNPWIVVAVNGTPLTRAELLNKRNDFTLRSGLDLTWWHNRAWRVLYSPDFRTAIDQPDLPMACPNDDPYHYLWDITRLVQPGENVLRITHLKLLEKPSTLVLRAVYVEVGQPLSPPAPEEVAPAPAGEVPTYVATDRRQVATTVRLSDAGGFELTVPGHRYEITTRTSLPNGAWQDAALGQAGGALQVGDSGTVEWSAPSYRVSRRVSVADDHVAVADTITNLTDGLVGVLVEHRVRAADAPQDVLLAGRPMIGEAGASRDATNPSVFGRWPGLGVGLVAEDDIFRCHLRSFCDGGAIGLGDDRLGLAAGGNVTLEWSIYPVPDGDYWAFVNAVRRNWGCNFEIPGPFAFTMHLPPGKPAEWYGEWARQRDLQITCGGIAKYADGKYAHGTGILHAPEFVAAEREWISGIHQSAPGLKALCYFHAQCCTEPDGETTYADSRLIDSHGEHLGYPYSYRLPLYLPTRDNGYGKALWGYVHCILDTIGADGLYWDEMSHSVLREAYDAPWDGCTVAIDPQTHAVVEKRTAVPLIMQPLQLDIVHYLRDHGKFLMANTQPMTRTMLNEKIIRFVETGTYAAMTGTHLGCPIGLGNHHEEYSQADRARNVRKILEQGGIYYGHLSDSEPPAWNFIGLMYPITPVELHAGVVLGEERILTATSGKFGWPDGASADVYVVDAEGHRVEQPDVQEVSEDGRRRYELRMPGDQFAIVVRRSDATQPE